MKYISILSLFVIVSTQLVAQNCSLESVDTLTQFQHCYRYEHVIVSSQVSKERIAFMKDRGIVQAINLRTPKETRKFKRKNFNEIEYFDSLGIRYYSIPIGNGKDDPHADKYGDISTLLNNGDKTIIYCKSGIRAAYVFMNWLIREKDCPEEKSRAIARAMGLSIVPDLLFAKEIEEKSQSD